MKNVGKFLPWVLLLIVSIAFVFVWQSMNAQLTQTTSELAALKDQQKKMAADSQAAIKQIEQEKAQILNTVSQEKQKLLSEMDQEKTKLQEEAQQALQLANMPEVQVQVSFRKAITGSGSVAVFRSTASSPIAISVEVKRSEAGSSKKFDLTIDPNRVQEIGHREGWAVISGDLIQISQSGHKAFKATAP
jgi:dsDNA-specific endonuclease/ATPase MutS2